MDHGDGKLYYSYEIDIYIYIIYIYQNIDSQNWQLFAWPSHSLLGAAGEHIIVHAPTGGGKTLAYLLPMLARLQLLGPTGESTSEIWRVFMCFNRNIHGKSTIN
jgi:hypothetical protein